MEPTCDLFQNDLILTQQKEETKLWILVPTISLVLLCGNLQYEVSLFKLFTNTQNSSFSLAIEGAKLHFLLEEIFYFTQLPAHFLHEFFWLFIRILLFTSQIFWKIFQGTCKKPKSYNVRIIYQKRKQNLRLHRKIATSNFPGKFISNNFYTYYLQNGRGGVYSSAFLTLSCW